MDKKSFEGITFSIPKNIKDNKDEVWKVINGFPKYEISNFGRVISNVGKRPKLLNFNDNGRGYYIVDLWNEKFHKFNSIHRLVAIHFVDNPENKDYVDHIDGNTKNNHYTNLRWVTKKENTNNENTKQNVINALNKNREKLNVKVAKCDNEDNIIEIYNSIREAARANNCDSSKIAAIINKRYKYDSKGYKYYPKTCGGYKWKRYYGKI